MNTNYLKTTSAIALGTVLGLGLSGPAGADSNPFGLTDLGHGYMVAAEGACGEGKVKEGSCGEAKQDPKQAAEGKCASNQESPAPKVKEGKCGEGKCGANKG